MNLLNYIMLQLYVQIQQARIEVITQDTNDFTTVVLNAEYVSQNARAMYQNGGNLRTL